MISFIDTFFPVPDYMRIPTVGIDISDRSVKYVELKHTNQGVVTGRFGDHEIAPDVVVGGVIKDKKVLVEVLQKIKTELGILHARVSLPEEKVFLFDITVPRVGKQDIYDAIVFQIEEQVPLAKDDVVFDYELISADEHRFHVQVHVVPVAMAEAYVEVLSEGGFVPVGLELEAQAIARTLATSVFEKPVIVVDLGRARTNISLIVNGIVTFTKTITASGQKITDAIVAATEVTPKAAEKEKKKIQLSVEKQAAFDDPAYHAAETYAIEIAEAIKKYVSLWERGTENKNKVKHVLLAGGGANLGGLSAYLSEKTGFHVDLVDKYPSEIFSTHKKAPKQNILDFSTATGLALGDFTYD